MSRQRLEPYQRARGRRLGALLKRARTDGRMQIAPLAVSAGVSVDTIRSIESGRVAAPSFFVVAELAGALDVGLDDLAREAMEGSR